MKIGFLFQHTFKAIRKTISPDVRKSVDLSIPSMPMVEACRADDFDFFAPFIAAGDLTVKQMQHACQRYYLGKTRSGRPVFWMMDDMLTPLDAHIGSSAWLSALLKAREPLIASWQVTHCLFGLHLLGHTDLTDDTDNFINTDSCVPSVASGKAESMDYKDYAAKAAQAQKKSVKQSCVPAVASGKAERQSVCPNKTVCVVESERSAVILSELFPEYVWMAYATTAHLRPELFAPLLGHKVVLFPRTDPTLSNFLFFKDLAAIVRQEYEIDISVDDTLEKRATPEQKERCIDLVDFIFDDIESCSQPPRDTRCLLSRLAHRETPSSFNSL